MDKIRIYIYGAGEQYRKWRDYQCKLKERIEVLGIVTTSDSGIQELDGYPVIRPEEIKKEEMDYVVIAIGCWTEIAEYLIEIGVSAEKIIRSTVFYREV